MGGPVLDEKYRVIGIAQKGGEVVSYEIKEHEEKDSDEVDKIEKLKPTTRILPLQMNRVISIESVIAS